MLAESGDGGGTLTAGHAEALQALNNDDRVGPQLGRLFGTASGASRIDAESVLTSLVTAMVSDDGTVSYSDDCPSTTGGMTLPAGCSESPQRKTIAPLPGLAS